MVKYCPGGDGPFEDWVDRCPECGRRLQADPPPDPKQTRGAPRANGKVVYLTTIPNEPLALLSADVLRQEGIETMIRPGGGGFGAWGSVATFAHELYVVDSERERALEILRSLDEEEDEEIADELSSSTEP